MDWPSVPTWRSLDHSESLRQGVAQGFWLRSVRWWQAAAFYSKILPFSGFSSQDIHVRGFDRWKIQTRCLFFFYLVTTNTKLTLAIKVKIIVVNSSKYSHALSLSGMVRGFELLSRQISCRNAGVSFESTCSTASLSRLKMKRSSKEFMTN